MKSQNIFLHLILPPALIALLIFVDLKSLEHDFRLTFQMCLRPLIIGAAIRFMLKPLKHSWILSAGAGALSVIVLLLHLCLIVWIDFFIVTFPLWSFTVGSLFMELILLLYKIIGRQDKTAKSQNLTQNY